MEDKYARVIELNDEKLLKLVNEKMKFVLEGQKMAQRLDELATQHKHISAELNIKHKAVLEIKKQILKRLEKVADKLLDKYEFPITTELENGKVVLKVDNAMQDFEKAMKVINKWKQISPVNK